MADEDKNQFLITLAVTQAQQLNSVHFTTGGK